MKTKKRVNTELDYFGFNVLLLVNFMLKSVKMIVCGSPEFGDASINWPEFNQINQFIYCGQIKC